MTGNEFNFHLFQFSESGAKFLLYIVITKHISIQAFECALALDFDEKLNLSEIHKYSRIVSDQHRKAIALSQKLLIEARDTDLLFQRSTYCVWLSSIFADL